MKTYVMFMSYYDDTVDLWIVRAETDEDAFMIVQNDHTVKGRHRDDIKSIPSILATFDNTQSGILFFDTFGN